MQPLEVSDWELQLGPKDPYKFLPHVSEVPREFIGRRSNYWIEFATTAYYHGMPKNTVYKQADGVDGPLAVRHIMCALRCTTIPRSELFIAVGYLASLWFDAIEIPGVMVYS